MPGPTFHAIAIVDIEGFGRRPNPVQKELRTAMYQVVRSALNEAGLDPAAIVQEDRGDGIILLDPGTSTLRLTGRFVKELDAALRQHERMTSEVARMRLRVAVHQGLCERDEDGWIGEAINTTARLVDAAPLKEALAKAKRATMALIVSDEIHRSVVRHEYPHIDSSTFGKVMIDAKELRDEPVWIHVPGYSYPPGLAERPAEASPVEAPGPPPPPAPPPGQSGGIANHGPVTLNGGDQIARDKIVYQGVQPPADRR
ncbi:hypothetical protein AB0F81_08000 [Actinoplanes sp. NPDC024001]|uniref:hypothetical protein n=1 Tax=Actinoplanes sp. NPDC024001 TaxID=3154598 RepID=UPI0033E84B74